MDKSETLATSGTRHNEVSVIQITLEYTEGTILNGQIRDTGNIGNKTQ